MLSMDPLQFLPARRADPDKLLCSLQLSVMCFEHRFRGGVLRSRLRELWGVHLGESLTATDPIAELRRDSNHSAANQRCDGHLTICIRFNHTWNPYVISASGGRRFADFD